MARNYLFLKILTRGTRISVLKNDPTTGSTLKINLKFSTLAPSIDNKYKIENGQKLLILEDLDASPYTTDSLKVLSHFFYRPASLLKLELG